MKSNRVGEAEKFEKIFKKILHKRSYQVDSHHLLT
jgi:hypothetical protein